MHNFEIVSINTLSARCYGKDAPYDHPAVYLKIDQNTNEATCPYCSKKFKYTADITKM